MAHYGAVFKALGDHVDRIQRLFIGGGNALNVNMKVLTKVIQFLSDRFNPRRISIYGRADAMKEKGRSGLNELNERGLGLIYWGVESGSADVLKYVSKKTTPDEMLMAGYSAELAGIDLSVMVMPGLGGIKHSQSHIDGTIRFLNDINARFVTFMAINAPKSSPYSQRMADEIKSGVNRPLSDRETVEQLNAILSGMQTSGQKVGMFDQTIDQVGRNPISFNVEFDKDGKSEALKLCNNYLKKSK